MPTVTENTVKITNISPGDCIPLSFSASVFYTNANGADGTVSVGCGGVAPLQDQAALGPSGTLAFDLVHAAAGSNHSVTATLKHGGVNVAGDGVPSVGVGNPCPIVIIGTGVLIKGLVALDPTKPLTGTFDSTVGNLVVILVQQPKFDGVMVREPLLTFADPAVVAVNAGPPPTGKWKHDVIPGAASGQHLRIVLTKDGKVKAIVRAIFKK